MLSALDTARENLDVRVLIRRNSCRVHDELVLYAADMVKFLSVYKRPYGKSHYMNQIDFDSKSAGVKTISIDEGSWTAYSSAYLACAFRQWPILHLVLKALTPTVLFSKDTALRSPMNRN